MKTPRSWSIRRSASRLRLSLAIGLHSPFSSGSTRVTEEGRTRVLPVERLGQLRDRLALVIGKVLGDIDADPVVDVSASGAAGPRWAFAAQPLDGAMLGSRRDADRLRPVEGRDLDLGS